MDDKDRAALIRGAEEQIPILQSLIAAAKEAVAKTRQLLKQLSGSDGLPQG
jgi:hypothetical protein